MKNLFILFSIILLTSFSLYSQEYAIRNWDYIGSRENKVAKELNLKFNEVWYDYDTFNNCDSLMTLNSHPRISKYVFDSYNSACSQYNWGSILSCIGAAILTSGLVMTATNFNARNGNGKLVNQNAANTMTIIGSLGLSVGITITLVARCDKRACNLSTYKEYNY